jgi:hypothetical protein
LKRVRATVTRARALRYQLGMKQDLAWLSGLVSLALVVACGETSNFVGEEPSGGSSGAAGLGAGGSAAGKSSGGSAPGGSKNTGGSSSSAGTAGKAPTGGTSDPGNCEDRDGNWVVCDRGLVHRTVPGTCKSTLPRAEALPATASGMDECTQDSECSEKANGYCSLLQGGFLPVEPHNVCSYACTSDADCAESQACYCGDGIGVCESSRGCLSDRDCGGALCTQYASCPGVPVDDFACENAADECRTDADCQQANKQFCTIADGHRVCEGVQCYADAAP